MQRYFVYILTNKPQGTLYTGSTSRLKRRIKEHKKDYLRGFTNKYQTHMLVYFEILSNKQSAIKREKQLKWWKRSWKIELIEKSNPEWKDLYETIA